WFGINGIIPCMSQPDLNKLDPEQLRSFAASLLERLAEQNDILLARTAHAEHVEQRYQGLRSQNENLQKQNHKLQTLNDKLTLEMSVLKRHHFGKHSEQLNVLQRSLLDDIIDAD